MGILFLRSQFLCSKCVLKLLHTEQNSLPLSSIYIHPVLLKQKSTSNRFRCQSLEIARKNQTQKIT